MRFLITNNKCAQEILCVKESKKRIRLKYDQGYAPSYIGKIACQLQEQEDELLIDIEGKEIALDYCQVDYLRKVLNAWHEHLNSPWLSAEEREERIYKLKK